MITSCGIEVVSSVGMTSVAGGVVTSSVVEVLSSVAMASVAGGVVSSCGLEVVSSIIVTSIVRIAMEYYILIIIHRSSIVKYVAESKVLVIYGSQSPLPKGTGHRNKHFQWKFDLQEAQYTQVSLIGTLKCLDYFVCYIALTK